MWTISEYEISEHKKEFTLRLPKYWEIISIMIKEKPMEGRPRTERAGQPCLYVRYSVGEKETEEVTFRNVQAGEQLSGPYIHIGSYQEVGYFKVIHLFREVPKPLGEQTTIR